MRHSEKARRNYELQRSRAKRQRDYQVNRNPHNDVYDFDPAADPRFVAAQRNKYAQEHAPQLNNENQSNDGSNNISPFIRVQETTV